MGKRRNMGELDAELDTSFEEHFIESDEMRKIMGTHSDIIFGAKGVGKTALRRGLMEIHRDSFLGVVNIDLDQISFQQIHRALSDLRDTSQVDIDRIASSTWLNVMAVYGLEAIAGSLSDDNDLRRRVDVFLEREKIRRKRPNERLLDQVERLFTRLGEIGLAGNSGTRLWLNPSALDQVDRFPSTDELERLLRDCQDALSARNRPALVCLDGFDSIAQHTREQRQVIFTGLIDAIQKAMKHDLLRKAFCFKAFLPQELTDRAKAIVWDSDKYALRTHLITWQPSEFERLLARRLKRFSRTKSTNFTDLWLDAMPENVRNSSHSLNESSFDYIVRHTQYRPRQVLHQLQRIFDVWDSRSDAFRVDASIIPKVVSSTNRELAGFVVAQIAKVNPAVSAFVQSLRGGSSVRRAERVRQKVRQVFGVQEVSEVNLALDELFRFGILGYQRASRVLKGMPRQKFHFSYVGDQHVPDLHAAIDDEDYLALCPMFVEYCGCSPADYGAVMPTEI